SLTGKIFLAFLALAFTLVVSLSSYTVYTVISQFAERNRSAISEKMKSLSHQLAAKGNSALVPDDRVLRALAEIYYSDLHLFDQSGYLVSSSEREWFNRNLLAPRINPFALRSMQAQPEPIILNEKLGDIAYQSGYCQLEIDGQTYYINLPYYARQLDLEQDLRQYAASSLTALLLFLIAAVLGAAFLANRITLPLVWLSREISRSSIEPLDYSANDEIGMLALAYNEKLEQLRHYGEELAKKERESAWRDLARQVAHEVKNPLTPIKLNAQFLQRQLANNDPESIEKTKNFLQGLISQVDVLAQMANEFSHFANLPAPQVEMFSVLNCLEQCVDALQWPEINVTIENQGDPFVSADRNQMTRVFNNLLKNAAQAIALRQLRDDQTGVIRVSLSVERDHVVLRFKDNGIGMDEPTLQKLFTPNFTTKSDGSGLGLSMSKQIIEQAGGTISASSEPNQGAEFEVKLPVKQ
ncbi:MAG TPA: ATP-binding protein, partial [Luteibaculaceae bacterium]|nr:ATP-binding protein [Luteibaculaceae bacterium]